MGTKRLSIHNITKYKLIDTKNLKYFYSHLFLYFIISHLCIIIRIYLNLIKQKIIRQLTLKKFSSHNQIFFNKLAGTYIIKTPYYPSSYPF